MMKVVVTIIDTTRIQDYIFGSNRLRENLGASYLVEQATRSWVYQELDKLGSHNIIDLQKGTIDPSRKMESGDLTSELIYAGGGNTTILFRCPDEGEPKATAQEFAWKLSTRILAEAPGLEVAIAHSDEPFDWEPDAADLPDRIKDLREGRLSQKQRTRQATLTPLLGLGVTAECASTGLVAAQSSRDLEPEARLVSREIIAKLACRKDAQNRLRKMIGSPQHSQELRFSDELDHLGRIGGEESYVAVIHVDGNEMGRLMDNCATVAKTNRNYIKQVRKFSEGVDKAAKLALGRVFQELSHHIVPPDKQPKDEPRVWTVEEVAPKSSKESEGEDSDDQSSLDLSQRKRFTLFQDRQAMKDEDCAPCWPILPLVYGGDDVTFVCNGQLGLSLAEIYMRAFTEETAKQDLCGIPVQTGAGVCIVKVHYPFRRAYQLSETLTGSAKRFLGERRSEASALDWHISATGLGGDLDSIRRRQYRGMQGSLLMRPLWLDHEEEWRTLGHFNRLVARFNYDGNWAGRRNKLKDLREVLRGDADRICEFLRNYGIKELPELGRTDSDLRRKGWEEDRCGYFDALEAMDHHLLLTEVTLDDGGNAQVEV